MALEELDLSRRRYLMQQVMRKVQYWQMVYMTSLHDQPSVAKGRYEAARLFYEWLAEGGDIIEAQEYLNQQTAHWKQEEDTYETFRFQLQLSESIAKGWETKESLAGWSKNVIPGFNATPEEQEHLRFLGTQYHASQVELWHLARLLADPFVKGEVNQPPPPPPRAVVDETDYDDENDEPD